MRRMRCSNTNVAQTSVTGARVPRLCCDISFARYLIAQERDQRRLALDFAALRKSHAAEKRIGRLFRRVGTQNFYALVKEIYVW